MCCWQSKFSPRRHYSNSKFDYFVWCVFPFSSTKYIKPIYFENQIYVAEKNVLSLPVVDR